MISQTIQLHARYFDVVTDARVRVRAVTGTRVLVVSAEGDRQWLSLRDFRLTYRECRPTPLSGVLGGGAS